MKGSVLDMNIHDYALRYGDKFPHQIRQRIKELGLNDNSLYENLNMNYHLAGCTYDVLYPHDTIPFHTHSYYEIVLCKSGHAKHLTDKHCFDISKGDIIIIPPDVRHCPAELHSMKTPYKRIIFSININFIEFFLSTWTQHQKHTGFFKEARHFHTLGTPHESLWEYFEICINNSDSKNPYIESFQCGLILCFLSKLLEAADTTLSPTIKGKSKLLEQIIFYTESNISKKITLQDIANEFHVSKSSISRLFQHTMGYSFHDYITQIRLDEAKKMLQEDINLDTISETVGFGDYSTFYRIFKKEYGITPTEYRQKISSLNSFLTESISL